MAMRSVHNRIGIKIYQLFERLPKALNADITEGSTEDILNLLKSCSDTDGHFSKTVFERLIPEFAKHEHKALEFLWQYLKMKNPVNAIEMLLTDALKDPGSVNFSDRNAFMLANLLLCNKELNTDIEMTPEDVLQAKNGTNQAVVKETAKILDSFRDRLFEKVGTIYILLSQAVESEDEEEGMIPARFLFLLERELNILLALAGGNTVRAVLRSAVKLYGNPASGIYLSKTSRNYAPLLIQHLIVAVRGLVRIGEKQDLYVSEQIQSEKTAFLLFSQDSEYIAKLWHLMSYVS